jgi:hypothetical protein
VEYTHRFDLDLGGGIYRFFNETTRFRVRMFTPSPYGASPFCRFSSTVGRPRRIVLRTELWNTLPATRSRPSSLNRLTIPTVSKISVCYRQLGTARPTQIGTVEGRGMSRGSEFQNSFSPRRSTIHLLNCGHVAHPLVINPASRTLSSMIVISPFPRANNIAGFPGVSISSGAFRTRTYFLWLSILPQHRQYFKYLAA